MGFAIFLTLAIGAMGITWAIRRADRDVCRWAEQTGGDDS